MELKIEVKLDKNTLKVVEGLVEAIKGITVSAPQAEAVPELVVTSKSKPQEEAICVPTAPMAEPAPTPAVPTPVVPTPAVPTPVVPTPVPVAEPVPQVAPTPAPTQTIKYSVQQLAVAAMQLKDQGRITDLQGLLVQFGVASMVELKDDQLDAFAQALRGLGVTL